MSPDRGSSEPRLRVTELTTGYRQLAVVREVSFEVHPGELACIVGPNGSGKSTALKAIAGLLPAFSGSVHLGDRDVTGVKTFELVRAGLGYVPQINDVFAPLSVEENLDVGGFCLDSHSLARRKAAVLEMFPRLKEMLTRPAGKLSGGERKMVAMARVLMLEPSVLILDEPTAGLTEELARRMLSVQLRSLVDEGIAVLLVEQRAGIALENADWVYVMGSGTVQHAGPTSDITRDSEFAELFLGSAASTDAGGDPGGES